MRRCRVFLAGEGPSDIGDLSRPAGYRGDREGFLQPILRKLIGADVEVDFEGAKITTLARSKIRTSDRLYARHASQAHVLAEVEGCTALVFCCDVDRMPGVKRSRKEARDRIAELRDSIHRGFADARRQSEAELATVVATPCRMIEAWALGDPDALLAMGARRAALSGMERPEDLWGDADDPASMHPKRALDRVIGRQPELAEIAEAAEPRVLSGACPLTFRPFAEAVLEQRRRCGQT
jgi:hypothetical protein